MAGSGAPACDCFPQGGDISGIGAAAAPQNGGTQIQEPGHPPSVFLRPDFIDRLAVFHRWEAGVGFDQQGKVGPLGQLLGDGVDFKGPQGAVDADGICAHPLQGEGHGPDIAAGEGAPPLVKGHGAEHRQGGVLLGGQQGRPHLLEVGHRLNDDEIRPGCAGQYLFPKLPIGCLKGEGPHGLQQFPQGADVQRHQTAKVCGRFAGDGHCRWDNLIWGMATPLEF